MKKIFFFLMLTTLVFIGCKKERKWQADTSNIKIDYELIRFEDEFFNIPIDSVYTRYPKWRKKYGWFITDYFVNLLGIGLPEQKFFSEYLRHFYEYCKIFDLYDTVKATFPAEDPILTKKIPEALKRYKYYFPDKEIPQIITCISGFRNSVFFSEGYIGISLDKYLGQDYEIYKEMFDLYLTKKMYKERIPIDVFLAIAEMEFPYKDSTKNLMTKMIYEGRKQYFLDVMFPDTPDTVKWGYTYKQWGWANLYEDRIWNYLIEHKLLFSQDDLDIKTFTFDAPYTTVFLDNSAPRAGTFIGYKIVKSYMNRHPEVSIKQLMEMTDYMKIYNESYYNP